MIYPPLVEVDPARIVPAAAEVPDGGSLRLQAEGLSIEGDQSPRR
jgi:hypothetical protein